MGSQIRPARVLLNRYRVKAGPSTSTVCASGALRSVKSSTNTTIMRTQNATEAMPRSVEPAAGKNHGLTM